MRKIKIIVEYDGTNYHGYQYQINAHTVQAEIEQALLKLTGEKISVLSAGRTDTGVHALGQVIAFDTLSSIPPDKWKYALNSILPQDIRVLHSSEAADDFHPRFSALKKRYAYKIYREEAQSTFYRNYAWCNTEPLDVKAMQKAGAIIVGQHDFRSFCSSGSAVKNFVRIVNECIFKEEFPFLIMEIEANGFLYNMVRIIVGTLMEVGRGKYKADYVQDIIDAQDRTLAGPTAPPQGLYLVRVEY